MVLAAFTAFYIYVTYDYIIGVRKVIKNDRSAKIFGKKLTNLDFRANTSE